MAKAPTSAEQRARYAERRAAGLCVKCKQPALNGITLCAFHRDYQARACLASSDEQRRRWRLASVQRVRDAVFAAYGKWCACCNETVEAFLTIDHVNGDGAAHRGTAGRRYGGGGLWRRVAIEGCPPRFRILCMNCNHAMGIWGVCPHGTLAPQRTNHPANRVGRAEEPSPQADEPERQAPLFGEMK